MPPKRQKDNGIWGKVGRGFYHKGPSNIFCTDCNHLFSPPREAKWFLRNRTEACGNCGSRAILYLTSEIRVPKLSASARVWRNFREMFIDGKVRYKKHENPNWPNPAPVKETQPQE